MKIDLKKITTEGRNPQTMNIDKQSTRKICELINKEDEKVAVAVNKEIDNISKLVDIVVSGIENGGRLIYAGAGTSGRIGIIDAVECRPTFSCPDWLVFALMAGGDKAFIKAVEGAEDDFELGRKDVVDSDIGKNDVLVGISASGRTPYVLGALEEAKKRGAKTGSIATSKNSKIGKVADVAIEAVTGCEAITGSTRMKSGTAQKMICNMISTAAMIKLGKVYENLMIDVQVTNEKLQKRAINIIKTITGLSDEEAWKNIQKYQGVKPALVGILGAINDPKEVDKILKENGGNIHKVLKELKK